MNAADINLRHDPTMALVYATLLDQEAQLMTGSVDLRNLLGVVYVKEVSRAVVPF